MNICQIGNVNRMDDIRDPGGRNTWTDSPGSYMSV
jgi:hypothetical protein